MGIVLIAPYLAVLLLLCCYGLHRARLAWLCRRCPPVHAATGEEDGWQPATPGLRENDADRSEASGQQEDWPRVTVQLPLYNEATVVQRLLEATARLDYPRDRLEIQVLDDSSDETRSLALRTIARLEQRGVPIRHVSRPSRHGYKAGALAYGLEQASGELIAIFDADFVPPVDFLKRVVGHFSNPEVGMVQARWGHLNREVNGLTGLQALMLDGHHLVENRARHTAGLYFNFSGTAGVWRRVAIEEAGGWQHDTLTEDLDLSYRAQMRGWRFVYRADVVVPSELPEDIFALRAQQYRWAKGTVQTARKLLGRFWVAPMTRAQRIEAVFHLSPHFAYPLTLLLTVLLPFALVLMPVTGDWLGLLFVDVPLCGGATGSLALFYASANRAQRRPVSEALVRLPGLMALGVGLSPHLSRAVLEGLTQLAGEFIRTPKRGLRAGRYRQPRVTLPVVEGFLAALSVGSALIAVETRHYLAAPFALLFAVGYGYVSWLMLTEQLARRRELAPSAASIIAKL